MDRIDLHTHSTYSDGTLTPTELICHGKEKQLRAIALTDHDTIGGLEEALAAGKRFGLEVIPGIELSSFGETEMHILGYFIDPASQVLRERLAELIKTRNDRNRRMVVRLQDAGFDLQPSDLPDPDTQSVTRAHIAAAMVKRGYVESISEAFANYLSPGKIGYIARERLSPKDCIQLIRNAGGEAYLAHLNQIRLDDQRLMAALAQLKEQGLAGIEGYYSEYDQRWRERCKAYSSSLGLRMSGGSDYHGANKKVELGTGFGNLQIPYSVLEQMRQKID